MKIKKIGWTTFLLTTDSISVITDPGLLKESGSSFPKTSADVALLLTSKIHLTILKLWMFWELKIK